MTDMGTGRVFRIDPTALDLREDKTVLSVFDVHGVADGPIAQARLPYSVPLGLHGSYVAG